MFNFGKKKEEDKPLPPPVKVPQGRLCAKVPRSHVKGYDSNMFHALCGAAIGLFAGYALGASGLFTWGKVRRQVEELGDRMLLLSEYADEAASLEHKVSALVQRCSDMDPAAFREEARSLMVELDAIERRAEEVTAADIISDERRPIIETIDKSRDEIRTQLASIEKKQRANQPSVVSRAGTQRK